MTKNKGATLGMAKIYNENSHLQKAVIHSALANIYLGIDQLDVSSSSSPFIIADFGSSHGQNSIQTMKTIIQYLQQTNKLLTSPLVIHNDLPTNDWATLFQLLLKDNSYQGVANGHSFYEECLPSNCLSIGCSSTSLNWMSKIPCNISNHCFYMFAEENERQAFQHQAKLDMNAFIEHRSRELLPGGILILSFGSVDKQGVFATNRYFDLLYTCAQLLFNTKELLEFTLPLYYRSLSECIDTELFDRCSLELIKADSDEIKIPAVEQYHNGSITREQMTKNIAKLMAAFIESTLRQVLENNGRSKEETNKLMMEFWALYEEKLGAIFHLTGLDVTFASIHLILKKKKMTNKI